MTRVLIPPIAGPLRPPSAPLRRLGGATMGTGWSVLAYGEAGPDAFEAAVEAALAGVIAEMSTWEPASFIARFNAAPAGSVFDAPADFLRVLTESLRLATLTGGAFDPACGALVDLWGFGPAGPGPAPSPLDIAAARASGNASRLMIEDGRIIQPGGLHLDFSGIAKGFAVDLVAAALDAAGAQSFLVEIGGELKGKGVKAEGSPWFVELETPPAAVAPGRLLLAPHGCAVATSGDYRRTRIIDGRRIAHTIDPATAEPLRADAPAAVSVVHPCCMTADGLATALTVLGLEAGSAFAARHQIAARFVMRDGEGISEHLTPALAAMFD